MQWLSRLLRGETARDDVRDDDPESGVIDDTPLSDPLANGYRIGPYIVREELPQGVMGRMYRIYHTVIQRDIALNVLRADLRWEEDKFFRLAREAALAGHPVHDVGCLPDGTPYVVVGYSEEEGALVDVALPEFSRHQGQCREKPSGGSRASEREGSSSSRERSRKKRHRRRLD